jgi:hypothetical protein
VSKCVKTPLQHYQGDQKIRKNCQIFQKIAQKDAKSKKAKISQTNLYLKAQTFETLKYLQQTMF